MTFFDAKGLSSYRRARTHPRRRERGTRPREVRFSVRRRAPGYPQTSPPKAVVSSDGGWNAYKQSCSESGWNQTPAPAPFCRFRFGVASRADRLSTEGADPPEANTRVGESVTLSLGVPAEF